jgi:transcriptional regulator with XRE-family HTH domain
MPKKKTENSKVRVVVASNLRYARSMKGLTREDLAELAGLHFTGLGAIERATSSATVDSISLLAGAIGVPDHVLLMPAREAQPIILEAVERGQSNRAKSVK